MKNTSLSECANPECHEKFKRLGEGRLFVRPVEKTAAGITQKAMWLCVQCSIQFELRFDRRVSDYQLVRRRHVA